MTIQWPEILRLFFGGFVSLTVALYVAPGLIAAAERYGIVDHPNNPLKQHKKPVAYLGGLVIFIGFVLGLAVTTQFDQRVLGLLLATSLVVSVGLIDDLGTLIPRDKFLGQILAALILVKSGIQIDIAGLPFPVAEFLSVFWMVTCMNAFNIVDVSDGLATSAAIVSSLGIALLALISEDMLTTTVAVCLLGSSAGFLYFNKAPARMYLGDTGSMMLGTLLGGLILVGNYSGSNELAAFIAPLCLLAIPLFDLGLVILARLMARKPIYYGSTDHFAVRLKAAGWSSNKVVVGAASFGLIMMAAGIFLSRLNSSDTFLALGGVLVFTCIVLIGIFAWYPAPPEKKGG
jgi:UDP-GlcNAc:undecaprenyl-phosphate/decaprenyl-phosphate GlcNAc-1-phosphate transferase